LSGSCAPGGANWWRESRSTVIQSCTSTFNPALHLDITTVRVARKTAADAVAAGADVMLDINERAAIVPSARHTKASPSYHDPDGGAF
jgi:hypothetical protein